MILYKYGSKKNITRLVNEGSISIGTLFYYKYMENKQGIADPLEGEYEHHLTYNSFAYGGDELQDYVWKMIGVPDDGIKIKLVPDNPNASLVFPIKTGNVLIYCTSYDKSKDVMKEFEGADSCAEIFDPYNFFKLLHAELRKKIPAEFRYHEKVKYGPFRREWTQEDNNFYYPGLLKTEKFLPQKEVRSIWFPINEIKPDPIIFTIPGLTKYCRLVNV